MPIRAEFQDDLKSFLSDIEDAEKHQDDSQDESFVPIQCLLDVHLVSEGLLNKTPDDGKLQRIKSQILSLPLVARIFHGDLRPYDWRTERGDLQALKFKSREMLEVPDRDKGDNRKNDQEYGHPSTRVSGDPSSGKPMPPYSKRDEKLFDLIGEDVFRLSLRALYAQYRYQWSQICPGGQGAFRARVYRIRRYHEAKKKLCN